MFDGPTAVRCVLLILAVSACREPPALAPPASVVVAQASSPEPDPEPDPEPAAPPPARVEPFDFWLPLIDPALVGTEQLCVVTRVTAVADPERRRMAAHRRGEARRVSCQRSAFRDVEAANIVVVIPDHLEPAAVVASTRDSRAPDVETRLRVRVLGVNARGETVNVELLSVQRVTQAGADDPTQRPSRCCRDRHRRESGRGREEEPAPDPVGFDFDEWVDHIGTRQLCVARLVGAPLRTREVTPEAIRVPAAVSIQMHVVCQHASGRSGVRLFFTDENAPQARWVADGSQVRGIIDGSGDLLVDFVRRAPNEARR